jgi:DNA-directed RNA polymerase subunit RPC12/RpoP
MDIEKMQPILIGGIAALIGLVATASIVQAYTPKMEYTCPICGAKFATQAELDEHMRTAHPSRLGYQCPYCSATFDTLDELVNHVASEHPDKPPIQPIDIVWE